MNGQDPNLNNGANGETLGMASPQSLGQTNINPNPTPVPNNNVNNIPNPTPMPNNVETLGGAQVESLDMQPGPVAQPIPGTEMLDSNPANNNGFMPNNNLNSFAGSTKMESIGELPPQEPKKKKKMSKILFIIIILILIAGVAFGVYYFLKISNDTVKLEPKTITIGIGAGIIDNVEQYADVIKGDASTCSVDTKNINTQTMGEYTVEITCGNKVYNSTVVVADVTAPILNLGMAFKTINSDIKVDDFVSLCLDETGCTTSFKDEEKVKEYAKTAGGPYEIVIVAKDEAGNEAEYTTSLYVTSANIYIYINFASQEEKLTEYKAKKVTNDILAFKEGLEFLNVARRDYTYTFESDEDYNSIASTRDTNITFDGITGTVTYYDKTRTLVISTDLSLDTLKSENNGEFPTTYQDILGIYKDKKNYTPTFTKTYPTYKETSE